MDIIKQYHQIIQSDNLKDTAFDLLLKQKKIKINWSNADGVTLLMQVAEHKYLHGFDACINAGADPNAYTSDGYSVLSHVLMNCILIKPDECDTIKRDMLNILQKNKTFEISFPTKYRVLYLEKVKEHDDLLGEFFVRVKYVDYDPNKIDEEDGWTALMQAAANNRLDVVISLMNHPRINLNVQDRYNNTALHMAVLNNHPAIVSQLLSDVKMDASLKDNNNRTALDHAKKGSKIYKYLKSKSTAESAESEVGSATGRFQEELKF